MRSLFPKKRVQQLAIIAMFALSGLAASAFAAERLNVVASFSILGDMTQRVGGDRIQLHTLVGRDADAHVYQPTPADAKTIAQAQVVVINGFGFEGWIDRLIKSSGYGGRTLIAGKGANLLKMEHAKDGKHAGNDHDGDVDPHAWQDLSNALRYVDNIAGALVEADPAGKGVYYPNASAYKLELSKLDAEIRHAFSAIPKERRKVVTAHDAFGYFGRAYGINFISPVGINTDSEPSASDVGRIIRQIRRERIPAVFLESISDPRLLEQIRRESGARIGGALYSDSLSAPNGPASTYLDMMRHNARAITAALAD